MSNIRTYNDFSYERKFFIKNLFNAKSFVSNLSEIHFMSFASFFNFLNNKLFLENDYKTEYIFRMSSEDDLAKTFEIVTKVNFSKYGPMFIFFIENRDMMKKFIELTSSEIDIAEKKILLMIKVEDASYFRELYKNIASDNSKKFFSEIELVYYVKWNRDNYKSCFELLISEIMKDFKFVSIDFNIDYNSFEDAPIKELHALYFYINNLMFWTQAQLETVDDFNPDNVIYKKINLKYNNKNGFRRVYLDDNLNIFLSKEDYYHNNIFSKFGEYIDKDGESISKADLDKIRSIIDIDFMNSDIDNLCLIDLSQNLKIMGDIGSIPYLTYEINRWMKK